MESVDVKPRRACVGAALIGFVASVAHCGAEPPAIEQPARGDDGGSTAGSSSGSGSGGATAGSSGSGSGATGSGGGSGSPSGSGGGGSSSGGSGSSRSGGGTFVGPQNPDCKPWGGTAADPGMYPETRFDSQPAYIPNNMIVLTLDDAPDGSGCVSEADAGSASCTVLDDQLLNQNGIKADFFINTDNRCAVAMQTGCWTYVQQLFAHGHYIANHTVNHYHLAPGGSSTDGIMHCTGATCIDAQLAGVERTVSTLTIGATPHLTRFRAPFGEPYQGGSATDLALVEPIVANYAVEVDWNFDSTDSNGTPWDPAALFQYVTTVIKTPGKGSWGIMLMHAVYPWTYHMLQMLIPYLKLNGFQLASVEDVICWRFGKHSWQIIPNRVPN